VLCEARAKPGGLHDGAQAEAALPVDRGAAVQMKRHYVDRVGDYEDDARIASQQGDDGLVEALGVLGENGIAAGARRNACAQSQHDKFALRKPAVRTIVPVSLHEVAGGRKGQAVLHVDYSISDLVVGPVNPMQLADVRRNA